MLTVQNLSRRFERTSVGMTSPLTRKREVTALIVPTELGNNDW